MRAELLTEGARRAIEAAERLAVRNGASVAEPLHLLWALLSDESQASAALRRAGVTCERLRTAAPLETSDGATFGTRPSTGESEAFHRVVSEATRTAALRGRLSQVGTDDLLAALATIESDAARALRQLGVDIESMVSVAETREEAAAPLSVDFDIRWRDPTAFDQTRAFRIIDAAANRAREALRVLEDYARFTLDDGHLTRELKQLRHALREILSALPQADLLRSRDTQADVGTRITTRAETVRDSPTGVARAAFKRAQEAVRSLEEFGKLWSTTAAADLERLRYRLYTLEKAMLLTELNGHELATRRVYLLVSKSACCRGIGPTVRAALGGGVGIVQLRGKKIPERTLIELGRRVRDWTREAGTLYVMNDRADLAVVTGADGVHLGQEDLSVKEARAIVGTRRLIGVSTHSIEQARRAVLDGADYIGVGPIFSSRTKTFDSLAGLDLVREVAAEISLPWFAIGGIDLDNVDAVIAAGAGRIAVSNAILSAEEPRAAAAAIVERLDRAERK